MDLFQRVTERATEQHGAISRAQLAKIGVDSARRQRWLSAGQLLAIGPKSYVVAGSPESWMRGVWCASLDLDKRGYIAGRTAARLHGLDGFTGDSVELLVSRRYRSVSAPWTIRSTSVPLSNEGTQFVDGIRCLTVHRLLLESAPFRFTRDEIENAIDSALRRRWISEEKLRTDVVSSYRSSVNGSRLLLDALVDTGGESRLERRFLKLVREAGLPRPDAQRVYRDGIRFLARVDFVFDGGHVVEVEGYGFHSSRQQRSADERRRNELRRQVASLTVFTYGHVTYEPEYVIAELVNSGIRSDR